MRKEAMGLKNKADASFVGRKINSTPGIKKDLLSAANTAFIWSDEAGKGIRECRLSGPAFSNDSGDRATDLAFVYEAVSAKVKFEIKRNHLSAIQSSNSDNSK